MERKIERSGWKGVVHSDFPYDKIDNIECEIYISVDDFDHYLFKEVSSKKLGIWDVEWDYE